MLALIVVAGLTGFSIFRSLNPSVVAGVAYDEAALSGDYSTMSDGEIAFWLEKRTGLDLDKLRSQAITKGAVRNFYNARNVAAALWGVGDTKKALEAYKTADSLVTNEDQYVLRDFYLEYSRFCLENGDMAEVKKVATKAISRIDKSSLAAGEKIDQKVRFEEMIWLANQ